MTMSRHPALALCGQALCLLALAALLAAAVNAWRPEGLPWRKDWTAAKMAAFAALGTVDVPQAYDLWHRGEALFVDARSPEGFASGHIPGAVSVPFDPTQLENEERLKALPMDRTLVIYCDGPGCALSHELAEMLQFLGYKHVLALPQGIAGWREAGYPMESEQ